MININKVPEIKSLNILNSLLNPDEMLHEIATTLLGEVRRRIHVEGQAADGSQIGTYSSEYLKYRTGKYATNSKVIKGKNKGQVRTTGTFTKGKNKGEPRPNFNRTDDPKVILSLTRTMENDFAVIAIEKGYGLGWNNSVNGDVQLPAGIKNPDNGSKAEWVEERYHKPIYKLTENEKEMVQTIANDYIRRVYESI